MPRGPPPPGGRLIVETSVILVVKQVWNVVLVLLLSQPLLTAVAGDERTAAGEAVDGQRQLLVQPWQRAMVVSKVRFVISSMESMVVAVPPRSVPGR